MVGQAKDIPQQASKQRKSRCFIMLQTSKIDR